MKYTKKQIAEAIAYWERQLERLNETGNPQTERCSCEATLKIKYNGPCSYSPASTLYDALIMKFGGDVAGSSWFNPSNLKIEVVDGKSEPDFADYNNDFNFTSELSTLIKNGHI